jgi:GT2 family glycosyltransferase/lipopolysaccharide/colanic/teichoic acid biosynthesis glycosyltransferase
LLDFFNHTPDAAAATCKIINPDGSFSIDCRHSIPTPSIALWKVLGFSKIFPKNRIFGQYNMTHLDENDTYSIPAISGSFMMIKKVVLERVGHFDERFFMYCEDIDLCHRINQQGLKIYYVPTTQIIHYKGQSTKKDRLDYIITFNRALYQFFQKYYAPTSVFIFRWLIAIGIFFRGIIVYISNFLNNHFPLLLDMLILNVMIIVSFFIRLEMGRGFFWEDYWDQFWVINVIATILFSGIALYMDIYPTRRFSIQSIVKVNIITFLLLASLTFFFKQFAFSRMVVLLTFSVSPILMVGWRAILRQYYQGDRTVLGKDLFTKPTLVIGEGMGTRQFYQKLESLKGIDYDLKGWIDAKDSKTDEQSEDQNFLGHLTNVMQIVKMYKIRQIIFSAHSLSYEKILRIMSTVKNPNIEFKMVPSNLEVVIGKSHIEQLDDYPLLEIDYSLGRKFNRYLKRGTDFVSALFLLIFISPAILLFFPFRTIKKEIQYIIGIEGKIIKVFRPVSTGKRAILERSSLLYQVLIGNLSLVGAPIRANKPGMAEYKPLYKPGLTGLVQLNQDKISSKDDEEKYHLYYLKNQSSLLDLEIILKTILRK